MKCYTVNSNIIVTLHKRALNEYELKNYVKTTQNNTDYYLLFFCFLFNITEHPVIMDHLKNEEFF